MLADARAAGPGQVIATDVCIVGGGAAGIALARQLIGHRLRVLLLESGDLQHREATRAFDDVASVGTPYHALDASRVRALGGTTHIWGGWCRPLEEGDFEARAWVPQSRWPFPRAHLDDWYARAHALCGLGPYDYRVTRWARDPSSRLPTAGDPLVDEMLLQIAPTRFGAAHRGALRDAANVTVMLDAHVLGLMMNAAGTVARGVRIATPAGVRVTVEARVVVLAAGGIENPRLLLASSGDRAGGVGNAHDIVGRYFTDHLHVPIGTIRPQTPAAGRRYQVRRVGDTRLRLGLTLTEAARREYRLLGSAVTLHNTADPHDVLSPGPSTGGYRSLMTLARAMRHGEYPDAPARHLVTVLRHADEALALSYRRLRRPALTCLTIGLRAEQAPDRDSRVTLDEAVDRFGVRRARLAWRVSDRDLDSVARVQALVARSLAPQQVAMFPRDGAGGWLSRLAPGAHHMGTTRMHRDPRAGVVDEHCRVHGTTNVYVAGSSVFPTGGWAPPTLTIVALALRLAEHLAARLR